MAAVTTSVLEWAHATLTLPGQVECGDRHVVMPFDSKLLIAVVDGLGHGEEAARVAERSVATLETWGERETPVALMERCHAELRGSRGVVMSLALFDASERTMSWLGVGNVEGRLLRRFPSSERRHQNLLMRPGVVGERLPTLQAVTFPIGRGDMIIFATDGIHPRFAEHIDTGSTLQEIADGIIAHHGKNNDDALVLVAKYSG